MYASLIWFVFQSDRGLLALTGPLGNSRHWFYCIAGFNKKRVYYDCLNFAAVHGRQNFFMYNSFYQMEKTKSIAKAFVV